MTGGVGLAGGMAGGVLAETGAVALGASTGGFLAASVGTGGAMLVGAAVVGGYYLADHALYGAEDKRFTQADLQNKFHIKGLRGRAYVEEVMGKAADPENEKNWSDIGKLNRLQGALQQEINKQQEIYNNGSVRLNPFASNDSVAKTEGAHSEIRILESAKKEVDQYIKEIREAPRRKEQQKELQEASGKLYIAIFNKNTEARGIKLNECDEQMLKWLDQTSMSEARETVRKLVEARKPISIEDNDRLIKDVKKATESTQKEHKYLYDQHLPDRAYAASIKQFQDLLSDMGGKRPDGTVKPRFKLHIGLGESVESRLSIIEAQAGLAIARLSVTEGKTIQQRIERLADQFGIDIREYGLRRARDNAETQDHVKGIVAKAFHDGRLRPHPENTSATPLTDEKRQVFTVTGTPDELKAFTDAMRTLGIRYKSDFGNQLLTVDADDLKAWLPKGITFDAMMPTPTIGKMQQDYERQAQRIEKETGQKPERPKEAEFVQGLLKRLDKDGDGKITERDFNIDGGGISEGEKALLKDAHHALKGSLTPEAIAALKIIRDVAANNGIKLDTDPVLTVIPRVGGATPIELTKRDR